MTSVRSIKFSGAALFAASAISYCALSAIITKDAGAQKRKARPACGLSYLPLVEGNSWTYNSVDQSAIKKRGLKLPPPETFTVTVVSVEGNAKNSTITLEEKARDVVAKTTITCSAKGMVVDPQSFFYTGEVGGGLGMTISNLKRSEEPTWPGRSGFKKNATWREDISANVERAVAEGTKLDKHAPARFEIEREVTVGKKEFAAARLAEFPKAQAVELDINGRAFDLSDETKSDEKSPEAGAKKKKNVGMPNATSKFWFVNNVGVVKVENRYGYIWELSEMVPEYKGK